MATKFKEEALNILKENFDNSELEAINLLIEGKTKCNSIKKSHLEAFRKVIGLMSKELNWSENNVVLEEEPKPKIQNETPDIEEEQRTFYCLIAVSNAINRIQRIRWNPYEVERCCTDREKL